MRRLSITSAVAILLGAIGLGTRVCAQTPASVLHVTPAIHVDSAAGLRGLVSWVAVSPSGVLVVSNTVERSLQFFSAQGQLVGSFDGAAHGMTSMYFPHYWIGDTLMVDDEADGVYYVIAPDLRTYRTSPRLSWNGGGTEPAMPPTAINGGVQMTVPLGTMYVEAIFPDGSALTVADSEHVPLDAWAAAPPNTRPFVQVSSAGVFQRIVAWKPDGDCAMTFHFGSVTRGFGSAFCAEPLYNRWSDGRPLAIVTIDSHGADSATYRVTAVRTNGDTVYSRKYSYSPVPLSTHDSASDVDGPIRHFTQQYPDQADLIRKAILDLPRNSAYPPFTSVLVGRDGTVWIGSTLRGPVPVTERKWTVLAPNGDLIGTLSLPLGVVLQDADRSNIWATESIGERVGIDPTTGMPYRARPATVVRYNVVMGAGVP